MDKRRKNILLYGVSRSGKTTLSKMVHKKLGYNVTPLDSLVLGFGEGLNEVGINASRLLDSNKAKRTSEIKLNNFLAAYLKKLDNSGVHKGLNFCMEGVYFNFDILAQKLNLKNYVIVVLGYPQLSPQQLADTTKKYDKPTDWSYGLSDEDRLKLTQYYVKMCAAVMQSAKKHNLKFFDVSQNRNKVLKKAFNYIKKNI